MTYKATAVPGPIATAQNDGKRLKTNWNLLPPEFSENFWRLVTDGCGPTKREQCVGQRATLQGASRTSEISSSAAPNAAWQPIAPPAQREDAAASGPVAMRLKFT